MSQLFHQSQPCKFRVFHKLSFHSIFVPKYYLQILILPSIYDTTSQFLAGRFDNWRNRTIPTVSCSNTTHLLFDHVSQEIKLFLQTLPKTSDFHVSSLLASSISLFPLSPFIWIYLLLLDTRKFVRRFQNL